MKLDLHGKNLIATGESETLAADFFKAPYLTTLTIKKNKLTVFALENITKKI